MRLVFRWRHWLLMVACLGALGTYLAAQNQRERNRIEAREVDRLSVQSQMIEDNLRRMLTTINNSLQSIIDEQPNWRSGAVSQDEAIRHLKTLRVGMLSVKTFQLLDAQGKVVLSNREELMGRDFRLREYYQAARRTLNAKTLHVSAPFQSALDGYVINLSRPLLDGNGGFLGVVAATVDPVDLQIMLNSMQHVADMRSTLLHGDGTAFVVEPPTPGIVGTHLLAADSLFGQHYRRDQATSQFVGTSSVTADERLYVLRTIQPAELFMDKPLVVAISRQRQSLFAQWQNDVRSQFVLYLIVVLFSSVALFYYRRQLERTRLDNQRLKLASEASGVGIWEYDLRTRRYHWDAAMFDLFGLTPESVNELNNDWRALLLPGELERMTEATRATINHAQAFDLTFRIQRKDGQVRFMRNRAALYRDDYGVPSRLIGATEDVTQRDMQEADLRVAATVFDCQEAIVVTDARQRILRVNRAFTDLFGYSAAEAIGQPPRFLRSARHEQTFYDTMWQDIKRDGCWQGEYWSTHKNGQEFPVWLNISAVRDLHGKVSHYVATHIDITLRKAAEDEIKQLAFHDPLTQLPNRRLLEDRMQRAVIQARRDKRHLALLFIDLDNFKPVNDEYGHQAGDELLQAVALRLQACVREADTVARPGGDEFVILLSVVDVPQDAMSVAEKVRRSVSEPFTLSQGQTVRISSSIGIAIYPEHGLDVTELSTHADAAMYRAKTTGRDRFELYQQASVAPEGDGS